MRRLITLMALLLSAALCAQERDSLLRAINQIKRDTGTYLYGQSTLPDEPNPEVSLREARKELKVQTDAFLESDEFPFLKEKKEIPEELIQSVTVLLRPDCYRTLAYIDKSRLKELEQALAEKLGSDTRKEALDQFIGSILAAGTIGEVLDLIAASPLAPEIRTGQKIDDESQPYANEGLLLFFEPRSRKIVQVMTPLDAAFNRKDVRTGQTDTPLKYRNAPLWVYIDGLKSSSAL